jgi:hypothetical protein
MKHKLLLIFAALLGGFLLALIGHATCRIPRAWRMPAQANAGPALRR